MKHKIFKRKPFRIDYQWPSAFRYVGILCIKVTYVEDIAGVLIRYIPREYYVLERW